MDNKKYIESAKKSIKKGLSVDDLIKRQIDAFDALNKSENLLFKTAYDLLFLYFPEAASLIKGKDQFINMTKKINEISYDEIASILKIDSESMGYDLPKEGKDTLSALIKEIDEIEKTKAVIEEKIENIMQKEYPNLLSIGEPILIARLIRLSNGVRKLSMMPSSKIQVLGAEKNLFSKGRRPKYGVIFSHPLVSNSKNPGKAAKTLASTISIAARADVISKKDIKDELMKRISKISKENQNGNYKG